MEQRIMTPPEAIQILDDLAAQVKLDRTGHNVVITALNVLRKLDTDYKDSIIVNDELGRLLAKPKSDSFPKPGSPLESDNELSGK